MNLKPYDKITLSMVSIDHQIVFSQHFINTCSMFLWKVILLVGDVVRIHN